ncbi:GntR family transcriptional regulator [Cohnella nanjingensis]|uniref:GntR family transcriptional regulator n=1 Tax=Cohnella nanjingensis TaxID=1387779 RepID=A0A7X0RTM2_9BACL|nr:GntR family transcriptional regulator [Cohnella nanjingensis]MBB6673487.1 GntR family transcriptional regulator [Cohnella nanjingensis]
MGNPSLRQQAYAHILAKIENGEFPKGSVTSEVQLSQMLDMSRTPVRAALQQLELEGYVRVAAKHGVLILDSSSQRVGDLLEMIASMALFAVSAARSSKQVELAELSREMADAYRTLIIAGPEDSRALVLFEYELLRRLIQLCNNSEMAKAYRTSASRLFWNRNGSRWRAPYTGQTSEQVEKLIRSVASDSESFREALFDYLHTLKLTWL